VRGGFGGSRETLRLYGSLTPGQKEALESEAGIQFGALRDAQWSRMSAIISDSAGVSSDIVGGSIQLVPFTDEEIKANKRSRVFRLTVRIGAEQEPRKTEVRIFIQSKETITAIRENRRKAKEAAEKAKEQAQSAPPAPPAQTQAAPSK